MEEFSGYVEDWIKIGGKSTLNAYIKLEPDERRRLLKYLASFEVYKVISIKNNTYVLTHAGVPPSPRNKRWASYKLDTYCLWDWVQAFNDYNRQYFSDAFLVTGHLPTYCIDKGSRGKIWRHANHIAIDTGVAFGETMGCLCLDTDEEFYLPSIEDDTLEIYTVFMGNDINGEGGFTPLKFRTLEEVWECSVLSSRRCTTFENFVELINEHGAVKMYAATVYKGKQPPTMRWFVNLKMLIPIASVSCKND